ncbi:MAG: response regulator [Flavobacteriaceae bacterium]|nr:response regulator [Flavobacteriaceae bacterium]
MEKVKILIVEDEIIIADNLCDTLEELGYDVLEPAISYTEAVAQIELSKPDIAILDIQLSGRKTGIDLAHKIREDYDFPFIFLSSNSDKATINEVKYTRPPAFLVKPFTKEDLFSALEIVLFNFRKKIDGVKKDNFIIKEALFIKDKGAYKKIKFDNILYLKSEHVYTKIRLKNNSSYTIRGNLNNIIENLNNKFIRIHKSYIINTGFIDTIDSFTVKIGNNTIPIGSKYKADLLKKINLFG